MEQRQEASSQSGTRKVSYVFQEGRINKIMKFNELVEIVLEKVKERLILFMERRLQLISLVQL